MWGTCKIVNVSWILFSTLVIGQNLLTHTQKHPFKVECNCILLRKRPSCRFMHSLCKNENIPMWGKHRCRITKETAIHLTRIVTYIEQNPVILR